MRLLCLDAWSLYIEDGYNLSQTLTFEERILKISCRAPKQHFSRRPSKLALLSQRVLGNEGRSSTQVKQRRVPTTDSPVESSSPEDSFSGNQQFFFFYLRSIDSLTFGALLRDRIQATIINTMEVNGMAATRI